MAVLGLLLTLLYSTLTALGIVLSAAVGGAWWAAGGAAAGTLMAVSVAAVVVFTNRGRELLARATDGIIRPR
jgi:hypothetical protein